MKEGGKDRVGLRGSYVPTVWIPCNFLLVKPSLYVATKRVEEVYDVPCDSYATIGDFPYIFFALKAYLHL